MTAEIKNNQLILTLDLEEPHESTSGKTLIVASSKGIVRTSATVHGETVHVGVNAFIYGNTLRPPKMERPHGRRFGGSICE